MKSFRPEETHLKLHPIRFLSGSSLAQRMRPRAFTFGAVEVDPRVGGKFRIVMRDGPVDYEHRGEYLAIEPPSRRSFTWVSAATDLLPTVVTLELIERGPRPS